jgi:hypothetical protein
MAKYNYTTDMLSDDKLSEFESYHEKEFNNKRRYVKTLCRYSYYDKKKPDYLPNIIDYAAEMLSSKLGVSNFNKDETVVEFHQINLFGDSDISFFRWHQDIGIIHAFKTTYTVIFYLRKDITVKGGNLYIRPYEKKLLSKSISEEIKVSKGKIIAFDGAMEHKPEKTAGFGCRDIIVVFFDKL